MTDWQAKLYGLQGLSSEEKDKAEVILIQVNPEAAGDFLSGTDQEVVMRIQLLAKSFCGCLGSTDAGRDLCDLLGWRSCLGMHVALRCCCSLVLASRLLPFCQHMSSTCRANGHWHVLLLITMLRPHTVLAWHPFCLRLCCGLAM
jgi:hypothetical protein